LVTANDHITPSTLSFKARQEYDYKLLETATIYFTKQPLHKSSRTAKGIQGKTKKFGNHVSSYQASCAKAAGTEPLGTGNANRPWNLVFFSATKYRHIEQSTDMGVLEYRGKKGIKAGISDYQKKKRLGGLIRGQEQ
jgi:hypothetical protein